MNKLIISLLAAASSAAVAAAASAPYSLRCEHLEKPLGVNTLVPRFSWKNNPADVKRQTAYEIVVGTDSLSVADKGRGPVQGTPTHLRT